uniref:VPS35 endosomal protein-sorting factor-like n=1 Tax=Cyprinus carpio TaxID=7962 RepID=A0A8C1XVM4_CYPCA
MLSFITLYYNNVTFIRDKSVTDSKARRGGRKGSTSSSSSSSSSVVLDPLSSMLDGSDPLSLFAAVSQTPALPHSISAGKEEEVGSDFEPWSSKRGEILSRFTTTEKLSIVKHPVPAQRCQRRCALVWRNWMT